MSVFGPVLLVDGVPTELDPQTAALCALLSPGKAVSTFDLISKLEIGRPKPSSPLWANWKPNEDTDVTTPASRLRKQMGFSTTELAKARGSYFFDPDLVTTDWSDLQAACDDGDPERIRRCLDSCRGELLSRKDHRLLINLREQQRELIESALRLAGVPAQDVQREANKILGRRGRDGSKSAMVGEASNAELPASNGDLGWTPYPLGVEPTAGGGAVAKATAWRELLNRTIGPGKRHYDDVSVTLELEDAAEPGRYELRYTLTFTAEVKEYVFALASRASVTDILMAECPTISDFYTFTSPNERDEFVQRLSSDADLIRLEHRGPPGTRAQPKRLTYVVMDEAGRAEHLGKVSSVADDVVLCSATVPGEGPQRLISTIVGENMSKDQHFCYWTADRPMYVETITVDCRSFTRTGRLDAIPLLGKSFENPENKGQYKFVVDDWLLRGNGVVVVW